MDRRINVLHVVLNLDVGGLENGVINLVNGLDPEKFRSIVFCIKHRGDMADRITIPSAKIYELNYYGGYDLKTPFSLARLIREEQIDVVHTRNLKAYYFGFLAAKLAGFTPIIHSEHGRDYPFSAKKMLMQRIFSWGTNAIVALSSDLKQSLVKYVGMNPGKVDVIVNGVDTVLFAPRKHLTCRRELGIAEDTLVIGAVGRLESVKNLAELFDATALIREKYNNVHVVIVGDGQLKTALERLVLDLGISDSVLFLGARNDVPALFNIMDIYALTSLNEGISNTLLEAMSSGLPVVASTVGGNPEIVSDQKTGLLYRSGEPKVLAGLIAKLIDDRKWRKKLGNNARKYVLESRSIHSMIIKYQELYLSAIK